VAADAVTGLRVAPYEPRLSLDYVNALASFDSYLGLAGYTQFLFSDVLAHHRLLLNVNLNGDVTDADAVVRYAYLPHRLDLGGTIYRTTRRYLFRFDDGHLEDIRDVDMGVVASASYPLSEAFSVRGETGYRTISRQGVWNSDADYEANVTFGAAGLVFDNARWGYVGPRVGTRARLGMEIAPDLLDSTNYYLASADLRHYTWVSGRVTLAMRLAGATSWGRDAPLFFLGGAVPHRLIWGEVDEVSDLLGFYSNYADMLRGYDYGALEGRRYVSSTMELRVPFIDRLQLAAPLPVTLSNGRGVIFLDMGTAFNDPEDFHGASTDRGYELDDIKAGIGFGFRLNLGYFVLREDTAWRTTIRGISAKPEHYFALGAEF
jgi:outer membrane protein assembly factor BamA